MIGQIQWRELMTPKPEDSERFYSELFNWKIKTEPFGPSVYRLLHAGTKQVGGIMEFNKAGIPAHWVSYVTVDDVDATANRAKQNGGTIANPPTDIPNIGRFAVLLDPQGAVTVAFKSAHPENEPKPSERPQAGEFCWEQLNTTAVDKGIAFYEKVYGWKTEAQGGMKIFNAGSAQVATVMQAPQGVPASWLTYVVVPKLADACKRAQTLGGKVLMDNIKVPGIGTYAVIQDNVGAIIGLFESA